MASYRASHRHAQISASKVRLIASLIRGKRADEALEILKYQPQRGARMLEKVLKSALGNAEEQQAKNVTELVVVDARADNGPILKRMRAGSRGMSYVIKKRMAHLTVVVE